LPGPQPQSKSPPSQTQNATPPLGLDAANVQIVEARGVLGNQALVLQLALPKPDPYSFSLFLPTLPGLVVALFGLWVAHRFTRSRDRRKEISDICASLNEAIDDVADVAISAWLETKEAERIKKIFET
jgi:hypothetical protein